MCFQNQLPISPLPLPFVQDFKKLRVQPRGDKDSRRNLKRRASVDTTSSSSSSSDDEKSITSFAGTKRPRTTQVRSQQVQKSQGMKRRLKPDPDDVFMPVSKKTKQPPPSAVADKDDYEGKSSAASDGTSSVTGSKYKWFSTAGYEDPYETQLSRKDDAKKKEAKRPYSSGALAPKNNYTNCLQALQADYPDAFEIITGRRSPPEQEQKRNGQQRTSSFIQPQQMKQFIQQKLKQAATSDDDEDAMSISPSAMTSHDWCEETRRYFSTQGQARQRLQQEEDGDAQMTSVFVI